MPSHRRNGTKPWDHTHLSIDTTEVDLIIENTNRQLTQQPDWNPLGGAYFVLLVWCLLHPG